MKSKTLIKHIQTNAIAVITHWDHFFVDREQGTTYNRMFTYQYLSGDFEGQSFVLPCHVIEMKKPMFEIVGHEADCQGVTCH